MDCKQRAAADKTQPPSCAEPIAARSVDLPVGTHTIKVPSNLAMHLQSLTSERSPALIGTRVWMQQKKNTFLLHLGDLELGTPED